MESNEIVQEIEKRIRKFSNKAVKSDLDTKVYYRIGALVLQELKVDIENDFFKNKSKEQIEDGN